MTLWIPDLRDRRGPRYAAIAEALGADTASGRLRPGIRLPTHRALAFRLGVTVGTVTRAYAEAARRGLVTGEVGRGTFVRARPAAAMAPGEAPVGSDFVDLSANLPPLDPDDALVAATLSGLARRGKGSRGAKGGGGLSRLLGYPPPGGLRDHRLAGASWIRPCGLVVPPERVLVSSGIQHGMTAVFAGLLSPGDVVLTEALTYPGMKTLASLLSLRLQGVAMDADGLRPDAFQAACRTRAPKALYCLPTLHNPTVAILPDERRREIAAIAREHGVLVIEDDVHGRLLERPRRAIAAYAPEQSVYLSGTSKALAPGLRVAFIAAPEALVPRIAAAIRATTWMAAPLMAEIAATWIVKGRAEAILRRMRKESAARHRLAARAFDGFPFQAHPAAYHLWLSLPDAWTSDAFTEAARRRGVAVTPAGAFAVGRASGPCAVRVCLGAARSRGDLERGLGVLASLLGSCFEPVATPAGP